MSYINTDFLTDIEGVDTIYRTIVFSPDRWTNPSLAVTLSYEPDHKTDEFVELLKQEFLMQQGVDRPNYCSPASIAYTFNYPGVNVSCQWFNHNKTVRTPFFAAPGSLDIPEDVSSLITQSVTEKLS